MEFDIARKEIARVGVDVDRDLAMGTNVPAELTVPASDVEHRVAFSHIFLKEVLAQDLPDVVLSLPVSIGKSGSVESFNFVHPWTLRPEFCRRASHSLVRRFRAAL